MSEPAPTLDLRSPRSRLALTVTVVGMLALLFGSANGIRKPPLGLGAWTLLAYGVMPLCAGLVLDLKGRGGRQRAPAAGLTVALLGLAAGAKWGPLRGELVAQPAWILATAGGALALGLAAAAWGRIDLDRWGAGLGDWRWWAPKTAALLAGTLALVGVWVWADPAMRDFYPYYKPARDDLGVLLGWCGAMALYMVGWEFFWRGFLLMGLARAMGPLNAILFGSLPFFLTHKGKPETELLGSFVFGLLLSGFCWRAKSCWPAVLLHTTLNTSIQLLCFYW